MSLWCSPGTLSLVLRLAKANAKEPSGGGIVMGDRTLQMANLPRKNSPLVWHSVMLECADV